MSDGANNRETHERLGLTSIHPRWMATVLCFESSLVYPDASWADSEIYPDPAGPCASFGGGKDDYAAITPEDFFDSSWTPGDEEPGQGIYCLTGLSGAALLVVPDLYSPKPLAPLEDIVDPVSLAGPEFQRCVDLPAPPGQVMAVQDLAGLRLDPRIPADLQQIVGFQQRLVDFAAVRRTFEVLLDVPPGLNHRQIPQWRTAFASDYAAAYHPWLKVSRRDDTRDALVELPPSAAAAGIVARTENTFGIANGPANTLALEVVDVTIAVPAPQHDELHPRGINVYLRERDGIALTGARTLSRDPGYRQLSVRRLVTMIRLAIEQQTQWMVFEPNNGALRSELRQLLTIFLRRLFRAGAFQGAEESEAFFVRCDAELNPFRVQDAGMLVAHVGIAPAEPLEFILIRLTRGGDGTLAVEG